MKRLLVPAIVLLSACQAMPPPTTTNTNVLTVAADTPQPLAQLPRTVIDYDRSLLNDQEKQVVAKLIEASNAIDEIYWRQVSEENPAWRTQLSKQSSRSALDAAGYRYFLVNKGPWDRLKDDAPFVGTKKKPAGAAFYPEDITKEELEKYVAAHPSQKDELEGLFTVVRRDGTNLVEVPYSAFYRDHLEQAAKAMREAAALTTSASLKRFLTTRADAFFSNDYRERDMAWM